jgi:outer membrane protein TolC
VGQHTADRLAGGRPAAADSALERWWAAFQDPILDGLVARAVERNLDLKIASARVREARAAHAGPI